MALPAYAAGVVATLVQFMLAPNNQLFGLASDAAGNFYVASSEAVTKYDPATGATLWENHLNPTAIAYDRTNHFLYVCTSDNGFFRYYAENGQAQSYTGYPGPCNSLVVNSSGFIYATFTNWQQANTIQLINPSSLSLSPFYEGANSLNGLAIDASDNVYAAQQNTILKIGPDGSLQTSLSVASVLHDITAIAVDSGGAVYAEGKPVDGRGNPLLVRVTPQQTVLPTVSLIFNLHCLTVTVANQLAYVDSNTLVLQTLGPAPPPAPPPAPIYVAPLTTQWNASAAGYVEDGLSVHSILSSEYLPALTSFPMSASAGGEFVFSFVFDSVDLDFGLSDGGDFGHWFNGLDLNVVPGTVVNLYVDVGASTVSVEYTERLSGPQQPPPPAP